MTTRLEAIDPQHPETVALMNGPLVLFAITESAARGNAEAVAGGQTNWRPRRGRSKRIVVR